MDFNALVIKVASRCNLNCSYCFMYNLGDDTYKLQPKFMDTRTVDQILTKVKNYVKSHKKEYFNFLFHGGEPMLMEKSFFITFCDKVAVLQTELPKVKFGFAMQTNGVLIDKSWCKLFRKLNVNVGVSIDGAQEAHDMYRKDHAGRGSYDIVLTGAEIAKKELGYLNLVSVINVKESPQVNYAAFQKMNSSSINYLLTDYTHDNYPYASEDNQTPTGDWLIELFDLWINDTKRSYVPFFAGFIDILLGRSSSDNNEVTALVVETNGALEVIDSLKACGDGFTKNALNINDDDLSDILDTPLGKLYFEENVSKLCEKCERCPIMEVCKGGRLVHRYSKENGFNNPSVYCKDLVKIIAHIQGYLAQEFPELYLQEEVSQINAQEVIDYLDNMELVGLGNNVQHQELEEFKYGSKDLLALKN